MTLEEFLSARGSRIGFGSWAIGGPYWAGEQPRGWGEVDDAVSISAIDAAYDAGMRFFDTANVYGAGHSEEIVGQALGNRDDVIISSKFGNAIVDPVTKQVTTPDQSPAFTIKSVEDSLRRLKRERIDVLFFHLNMYDATEAEPLFDALETLRQDGKIGIYGWSTDSAERAAHFAARDGFGAVQFDMNLFRPATEVRAVTAEFDLLPVARQPLAMGLLAGRTKTVTDPSDLRSNTPDWLAWYKDGEAVPEYAEKLNAVRELLQSGGRTLAQGSMAWIWATDPTVVPIPGIRTPGQAVENARASDLGPLSPDVLAEIDALLGG